MNYTNFPMYKLLYFKLCLLVFTLPNLVKAEIPVDSVDNIISRLNVKVRQLTITPDDNENIYLYIDSALELGYKYKRYQKISPIVANYSINLQKDGKHSAAKFCLNKLIPYHNEMDSLYYGILLSKRGIIYMDENNLDSAKTDLLTAVRLIKDQKYNVLIGDAYWSLSHISEVQNDFYNSILYSEKARDLFIESKDIESTNVCQRRIIQLFSQIDLYDEAIALSEELIRSNTNLEKLEAIFQLINIYDVVENNVNVDSLVEIGVVLYNHIYDSLNVYNKYLIDANFLTHYVNVKDVISAEPFLEKLLNSTYYKSREIFRCTELMDILFYYVQKKDLYKAKDIVDNNPILHEGACGRGLFKVLDDYYKLTGDINLYNEQLKKSLAYHKNENRKINSNKMAYMHAKFESEKKEQEIKLQEAEIEILKEKDTNKTRLIWFSIVGGLALGIFLILRVRMYRLQKNALQNKNKLVESEKKYLNVQLRTKEKALTDFAQHLSQKNEAIEELKEKVQIGLEKELHKDEILGLFSPDKIQQGDWNDLQSRFSKVHASFFEKLKKKYPQLSVADEKLCVLIKLGMSSKEIANILLISPKSVDQKKYRLKKKMDDESNLGLTDLLKNI